MNIKRYIDMSVRKAVRRAFTDSEITEAQKLYDLATSVETGKYSQFRQIGNYRRYIILAIDALNQDDRFSANKHLNRAYAELQNGLAINSQNDKSYIIPVFKKLSDLAKRLANKL